MYDPPTGFFNGRMDDFALFNQVLSANDVSSLYHSNWGYSINQMP
jgi:hypothetical protein